MKILRRSAAVLGLIACSLSAEVRPPKKVDEALRARVKQFYSLIVQKKYREAERLVAPESRDAYYEQEKPALKDFAITGVVWSDKGEKADVNLVSLVTLRRPLIGAFDVRVPYASHWTFEHGQWMWYVPHVFKRQTPFGVMKVDPDAAKESGVNLAAMIAKGPSQQELLTGVKVSSEKLTIPEGKGNTGSVTLENTLPGIVRLSTDTGSTVGITAELSQSSLGLKDKGTMTIRRVADNSKGGVVTVRVTPTGQVIGIVVQ